MLCNIAVIYGIGLGVMKLINSTGVGEFIFHLAIGVLSLMIIIVMSILCLWLVAELFDDEKVTDKVRGWLPFLDM